ncbi:MAG: L,D-transpeptidase family protein, partial [Ostreibacterium sp.]
PVEEIIPDAIDINNQIPVEEIIPDAIDINNQAPAEEIIPDGTDTNNQIPVEEITDYQTESVIESNNITTTDISIALANLINNRITFIQWQGQDNRLRSPDEVKNLYQQTGLVPLWTNNGRITSLAEQVIQQVLNSKFHALRPEIYHSNAISSLQAGQIVAEPAKFDVLISDAFVTLKSHLTNGIVNPKLQFNTWNKKPEDIDFVNLYQEAQARNDINPAFRVKDADYRTLQKAYAKGLVAVENRPFIRIPAKTLKGVYSGVAVRVLRHHLGLPDDDVYDDELTQAVEDYQRNNGLGVDGIAGFNTLESLNRSPADKLQILAINMERYRWGYIPKGSNYIWVNIPAYKMAIKKGNEKIFQSNVIVGRPKRPTPIFSDTLENVVLAPYWNVPKTIFKKDKLPRLIKNPNVLKSDMQAINLATGKIVPPASVDWIHQARKYRLRQRPGPKNALGRMKFLFPNPYAIYLHDTPSRLLFKHSKRDLSSGCIRVQRAEDLAVFLLKDMGYDRSRIKEESHRNKEKWIRLTKNKHYPVFLDYYTAWVNDEDKIRYSKDIYHYDNQLKELYKETLNNL